MRVLYPLLPGVSVTGTEPSNPSQLARLRVPLALIDHQDVSFVTEWSS